MQLPLVPGPVVESAKAPMQFTVTVERISEKILSR